MKKALNLFFTLAVMSIVFSGCRKSEPPERIERVCRSEFGQISPFKKERRVSYERFGGKEVLLEEFCTPLSFVIWQTDMIFTGCSEAEIHELLRGIWNIDFAPGCSRCELSGSVIETAPAYTHGPDAIRVRIMDLRAAKIFAREDRSPEAADARKRRRCQESISLIEEAMEHFFTDTGRYPRVLQELTENILMRKKWNGPYMDQIPTDPWGDGFHYRSAADGKSYELYSGNANDAAKSD